MKKWMSFVVAAALVFSMNLGWIGSASAASTVPKLFLDGKLLQPNSPPIIVNDSVLVPIRTVAEHLGYNVAYDTAKKQVNVEDGSVKILMTIGKSTATVNGKAVSMIAGPVLRSGTTFIPLRFVGETLGLQIRWEAASRTVYLFSDPGTPGKPPIDITDPDGGDVAVVDEPSGGNGEVTPGEGGQSGGGTTPEPAEANAHLHEIRYVTDAVVINYEGSVQPTASVLKDPDRLIVDLPGADYAADFVADFMPSNPSLGQVVEMAVPSHEALKKVRFSQYSVAPYTARIVLDFNQAWDYQLINDTAAGELTVQLIKPVPKPTEPTGKVFKVVLDAGHGGKDPGAHSVVGKWEKEFNLSIVRKVEALLAGEKRINLILTRKSDVYPSLDDRVNLANSVKADIFISVHGNSYNPSINGTETYYSRANSLALAKVIHKNLVAATKFKDNGVRNAGFKVIKSTTMPAVLLEVGYLSNQQNASQMYNDAFQNRVAASIAASIKQYFKIS